MATETSPPPDRPKIGLVLSGGGARGIAHVGVIKVLEQLHIPIDLVVGTSMGSIVGGLYASGLSGPELETTATQIDWDDVFHDAPRREELSFHQKQQGLSLKQKSIDFMVKSSPGFRDGKIVLPQGLIQGQKLNFLLKSLTLPVAKINDFDKLAIPYRAVATNIETGEAVILKSGNLANAMRASMSVPSVFAPIRLDRKLLVDGGIADNLPIDVAKAMGAEVIIAVDVGTPLLSADKIHNLLDITDQMTRLLGSESVKAQIKTLKAGDVLIRPALGDLSSTDFGRAKDSIAIGEQAANQVKAQLQAWSMPTAEYQAYLTERQQRRVHQPITIDFIRVVNNSRLSEEVITKRIHAKLGEEPNLSALRDDFATIYGLDLFESVNYEIIQEQGQTGLQIETAKKSWGPNYLQFGLKLSDNMNGETSYEIGASYTQTELNSLGGEWRMEVNLGENPRLFTQFYQPVSYSLHYFLSPYIEYQSRNVNQFHAGDILNQYRLTSTLLSLEGGRELENWGEIRMGIRKAQGKVEVRIGNPPIRDFQFEDGEAFLRLSYDKIDNVNFPRRGAQATAEWSFIRKELGADSSFNQLLVRGASAHTWNQHTLVWTLNGVTVSTEDVPLQYTSPLGGFLKLSGYQENELRGKYVWLGNMIYYHAIPGMSVLPTYLGCSLEAGNVWDRSEDISFDSLQTAGSIFLGMDAWIGPVYLGTGYAKGGHQSFFLYLGKRF